MRLLLALGVFLVACDPPAPPTTPPAPAPAPAAPSLPPPGVLRLASVEQPSDLDPEYRPTSGLPAVFMKAEYAGPREDLVLGMEFWSKGHNDRAGSTLRSIRLPYSGVVVVGFKEARDAQDKPLLKHFVFLQESPPEGGSSRVSTGGEYAGLPSLAGARVVLPAWPLEIADGNGALFWAVFVNEPAGAPEGASLEERARRAEAAWLFRIRTQEWKK